MRRIFVLISLPLVWFPSAILAQETLRLTGADGLAYFMRTWGLYGGQGGDAFRWRETYINVRDTAVIARVTDCVMYFDMEWLAPGSTTCSGDAVLQPGDSLTRVFESVLISGPADSMFGADRVPDDWRWPKVLFSWEITTDSLDVLPTPEDLAEVTELAMYRSRIQAVHGSPDTLHELADRYPTLAFRLFLPALGRASLRACFQHRDWGAGCQAVSNVDFSGSAWGSGAQMLDVLESMLPRVRDRLGRAR